MAEKLTDARVRAATANARRYSIMDAKEAGLELRVHLNGKKTWALRASVEGRDIRLRLGTYGPKPLMSLDDARGAAAAAKVRLRAEGDFRGADRAARTEARERRKFTINALADAWLIEQTHLRESTRALYAQILDTHIRPRFGERPLDDVSRADARQALRQIGEKHPRASNATKQVLGALFRFAANELERDCNNPVAGMRGYAQPARTRALMDTEIKRWWASVNDPSLPPGPVTKLALMVALFSAQRAGEIVGMTDAELDFSERVWIVQPERTKSGRGNLVPLTGRLIAFIKQAQALRSGPLTADAPVFGITRHALSRGMARLVAKIDTVAAPFEAATVHDLRRSARTLLARERLGVGEDVSERLLSHQVGSALTRTYNVYAYAAEKRRALEALDIELDRIVSGRSVDDATNVMIMERFRTL